MCDCGCFKYNKLTKKQNTGFSTPTPPPQSWSYNDQSTWSTYPNFYSLYRTPLNIIDNRTIISREKKLTVNYNPAQKATYNMNDNFVIYTMSDNSSSVTYDGTTFNLVQFHFHNVSENLVNGKYFPIECHFVHQSEEGELLIMGLLMKTSENGSAISEEITTRTVGNTYTFDLSQYNELPKNDYYEFKGSLTTPPFGVGEQWILFNSETIRNDINLSITEENLLNYVHQYGNNRSNTINQYNSQRFNYTLESFLAVKKVTCHWNHCD